jgi:CPA1 family monovalent cation:H+ antiporter
MSEAFPADSRRLGLAFWRMTEFLLNGLAFILLGLQLRAVYADLTDYTPAELLGYAVLVSAAVALVRIAWVFATAYLPWLPSCARCRDWREVAVVAWSGMRGVDSLAAALALPLAVGAGGEFPQRGLITFLAFGVILATLVLQGLPLPALIRLLGLREDCAVEREEAVARLAVARAALRRLDELAGKDGVLPEVVEHLRGLYRRRARRSEERLARSGDGAVERHAEAARRLRLELLRAEREAVIELRDREEIGDEALHRVERDLDLEEMRLQPDEEEF